MKISGNYNKWCREVASLNYLNSKGFIVPYICDYNIFNNEIYWILWKKKEGEVLINQQNYLNKKEYEAIIYEMGITQSTLHNISISNKFGDWDYKGNIIDEYNSYSEFVIKKNRKQSKKLISKNYSDNKLFKVAIEKMMSLEYNLHDCNSFALCHNDFTTRNILVKKNYDKWRITGLIDFELCYPADPESDLARFLLDIHFENKKNFYLKGYSKNKKLSYNFNEKILYYKIALCLEICSWSYLKANDYYNRTRSVLKDILE